MDHQRLATLCVTPHATIRDAILRLNETGMRIVFVSDANAVLLGTVTDGDLRRGILAGRALSDRVAAIMQHAFTAVSADVADIRAVAVARMREHRLDHIPVVDAQGRIVDSIALMDCIGAAETQPLPSRTGVPVIIMAGGQGVRLDPFTKILPKPLIPIGDKPIVEHIMDAFYRQGFDEFHLIVHHKRDIIRMYFRDAPRPYTIGFIEEEMPRGTAGGLVLAREHLRGPFVVTNCDTILDCDYADVVRAHTAAGSTVTIIGSHKIVKVPYGVLRIEGGIFAEMQEKPEIDLFVNTGTYVFDPRVLEAIGDAEMVHMDALIRRIHHGGGRIGVYPHWNGWFDVGQWDEYRESVRRIEGRAQMSAYAPARDGVRSV